MVNPSKSKGTAAETALVRWARANGFPGADRQPLRGNRDAGDVALCPGVIVEVKAHKSAANGQPGPKQLETWLTQTDTERDNAGAAHGMLVVKRSGTADPAKWWAYMRLGHFLALLGANDVLQLVPNEESPICTTVTSLTAVLRATGYGTPHEGDQS